MVISEQQNLQYAIIAMERIAFLVSRCTIYEKLYLIKYDEDGAPDTVQTAMVQTAMVQIATVQTATGELRRALVILYTAILRALSRCMRIFNGMLA